MRKRLACKIESLADKAEIIWNVSVGTEDITDAVTLFTALRLGKLNALVLVDAQKKQENQIQICYDSKKNIYNIEHGGIVVQATDVWADAILSLFTGIRVSGWSHLAHIDQEFSCADRIISLCVNVMLSESDS